MLWDDELTDNKETDKNDDVIQWEHFLRYWPFVQRPVTRSFDVFFDLRLNKRLSKQSWGLVIWDAIAPTMTAL